MKKSRTLHMFFKPFYSNAGGMCGCFFLFAFGRSWLYGHRLCVVCRGLKSEQIRRKFLRFFLVRWHIFEKSAFSPSRFYFNLKRRILIILKIKYGTRGKTYIRTYQLWAFFSKRPACISGIVRSQGFFAEEAEEKGTGQGRKNRSCIEFENP